MSAPISTLSPLMIFKFRFPSGETLDSISGRSFKVLATDQYPDVIKIIELHFATLYSLNCTNTRLTSITKDEISLPANTEIVPIDFQTLPAKQQTIALFQEGRVRPEELHSGEWIKSASDIHQFLYDELAMQFRSYNGVIAEVYCLRTREVRKCAIKTDADLYVCDLHRLDPRSAAYCDFYKQMGEENPTFSNKALYQLGKNKRPYDRPVTKLIDARLPNDLTDLVLDYLSMNKPPRGLLRAKKHH
jgi:hypothetical protein